MEAAIDGGMPQEPLPINRETATMKAHRIIIIFVHFKHCKIRDNSRIVLYSAVLIIG